ncbi:MAG: prepilin-type N-terminal cleavage/methylation domain-containing protein [Campylobacteraceae bacterium]|jgi:prepilin-type N-terminal cleavage/methylation domain-containing protein|nr:prepilin-type N-terminal cleavage/methylation domain-containing protein [Campylobacteraceae bacterium]
MKRDAFTLVEVVVVIVLFGIIATIGANIIAKMYMNYMQARTVNYLQTQSSITLEQISRRLQYRIKDTIVARKTADNPDTVLYLGNSGVGNDFNVIEWIGYSNEALRAGKTPGWSGFIDLDNASTSRTDKTIVTLGSNLVLAENIISALSNNKVNLSVTGNETALIFKGKRTNNQNIDYGWDGNGGNPQYMLKVTRDNTRNNVFKVADFPAETITMYEQYYLAHSAYAIVPVNERITGIDFDLELRYNYRPWTIGGTYDHANTQRALLATQVNLFRIKQVGNTIRIKLCLHDGNKSGFDNYIAACKEEVVL